MRQTGMVGLERGVGAADGRRAFLLLAMIQVVLVLAITVVAIPLPVIQRDLGLSSSQLTMLNIAYGLTFGGLLLAGGRLADAWGRRRILRAGVAVFAAASVGAGLAPAGGWLLGARMAQGVGAALAAPAAMALLGTVLRDPARHARATAVWGALAGAGAGGGLLLSGLVITYVSWRWLFAVPALAAAAASALIPRLIPPDSEANMGFVHVPAGVVLTVAWAAVSYGAAASQDAGWASASALLPLLGGAMLVLLFAGMERRAPQPLVPWAVMAEGGRLAGLLTVFVTAAGHATTAFLLALYLQQVRGLSPLETSAAFLPFLLGLVLGPAAARLAARFGASPVAGAGLLFGALGLWLLSGITAHTPYGRSLLGGLVVFNLGTGLAFAGATGMAVAGVPDRSRGSAAALVNAAMETGPTVGLALLAAAAGTRTRQLSLDGLDPAAAVTGGYTFAFSVAALVFAGALALLVRHLRRRGSGEERSIYDSAVSR